MIARISCLALSSLVVLCGCASQPTPPLFFGELTAVGIDIGAGPGSGGMDFTLGFKAQDIAIIPVSAVNKDGKAQEILAWNQEDGGNRRDALSVFGQFTSRGGKSADGDTSKTARSITLGRFFATGLAATRLAEGYRDGWAGPVAKSGETTKKSTSTKSASSEGSVTKKDTSTDGQGEVFNKANSLEAAAPSKPYAPPLVFAQSDTAGIGITTSVADGGTHFTLGYTGRDIAFVPVMARQGDGSLTRLGGRDQVRPNGTPTNKAEESRETDALSVFGQFKVDTETKSVQFGLSRFFTTGMAARNLAEGFKSSISRELQAQQQTPAGTATAGSDASEATEKPH